MHAEFDLKCKGQTLVMCLDSLKYGKWGKIIL